MHIIQLKDPSPYKSNAYYLPDQQLLIDTGAGHLPLSSIEQLTTVVLTHGHPDHVGGIPHIRQHWTPTVYMHPDDSCLTEIAFQPLKEGTITVKDLALEIIHTPGHSPGSICIYLPQKRLLFAGDTVFGYGIVGRCDIPYSDYQQLQHSLQTLVSYDVEWLYSGHGKPLAHGNWHIQQALEVEE